MRAGRRAFENFWAQGLMRQLEASVCLRDVMRFSKVIRVPAHSLKRRPMNTSLQSRSVPEPPAFESKACQGFHIKGCQDHASHLAADVQKIRRFRYFLHKYCPAPATKRSE